MEDKDPNLCGVEQTLVARVELRDVCRDATFACRLCESLTFVCDLVDVRLVGLGALDQVLARSKVRVSLYLYSSKVNGQRTYFGRKVWKIRTDSKLRLTTVQTLDNCVQRHVYIYILNFYKLFLSGKKYVCDATCKIILISEN